MSVDLTQTASGRRDRKRQATRDALVEAAADLFQEHGFDETTTEQIADRADVSQRTFFRHFASKEAVLYGDDEGLAEAFRRAIEARPDREDPVRAVSEAMRTITTGYQADRDRTLLQARLAAASPAVSAYSRAVVQRRIERSIIDALAARLGVDPVEDPRPEVVAGAAVSALRVGMKQWVASGGRGDLEALAAAALESIRHAVH